MDVFEVRLKKTDFEFEDETDRFGMTSSSSIEWVWGLGGYLQNLGVNEHDFRDRNTPFLRVAQGLLRVDQGLEFSFMGNVT